MAPAEGTRRDAVLRLAAALQQAASHPLARAGHGKAPGAAAPSRRRRTRGRMPGRGVARHGRRPALALGSRGCMHELGWTQAAAGPGAGGWKARATRVSWLAEVKALRAPCSACWRSATPSSRARAAVERLQVAGHPHGDADRRQPRRAPGGGARNSASTRCAPKSCRATRRAIVQQLRTRRPGGRDGRRRPERRAGAGGRRRRCLYAMATGTDVATEAAGITLMRGDPRLVADALDISRRTYSKIKQGLFWAFALQRARHPAGSLRAC